MVCPKLPQQDAEELRADINRVLRGSHPPKSNLNRAELQAIRNLTRDKSMIVLTADKGVTMVVMDIQEYINKGNNLLAQPAYRPIPNDPTHKVKAKLISILRKVKKETRLEDELFQKEMDNLRKALTHSKYSKWAIDRVERRLLKLTSEGSNSANTQDTTGSKPTTNEVKTKNHIVIPYT